MSVAIIQGSAGGLGLALTQHILKATSLKVYALTHKAGQELESKLGKSDRLSVLGGVDVRDESTLQKAAKEVEEREGKEKVRLIACLAGILHPERSLSMVDPEKVLDTFRINTIGHLLTYKHFVPLIPSLKAYTKLQERWQEGEQSDPAKGLVDGGNSLCFSLSARVGSISDNEKGGWYSYRSSKAALNQVVRTLDHELQNKSTSALAVGYHPGTVLTSFAKPIIGDKKPDPSNGLFKPEQAVEHMVDVMSKIKTGGEWGGRCFDWRGKRVEW